MPWELGRPDEGRLYETSLQPLVYLGLTSPSHPTVCGRALSDARTTAFIGPYFNLIRAIRNMYPCLD